MSWSLSAKSVPNTVAMPCVTCCTCLYRDGCSLNQIKLDYPNISVPKSTLPEMAVWRAVLVKGLFVFHTRVKGRGPGTGDPECIQSLFFYV